MSQGADMRQIKSLPEVLLNITEAIKNLSGEGVLRYWGEVNTYSDLPPAPKDGAIYKVIAEDEEHGIGAGDRVVYFNGVWEKFGGSSGGTNTIIAPEDNITYMTAADIDAAFS